LHIHFGYNVKGTIFSHFIPPTPEPVGHGVHALFSSSSTYSLNGIHLYNYIVNYQYLLGISEFRL